MKKKSLGTILAVGVGLTFALASPVCQTTGWKSRGVAALANQPAKISGNTAYYNVS